jgi:hypothetical protein
MAGSDEPPPAPAAEPVVLTEVVQNLPRWVHAVRYDSKRRLITMTVIVPAESVFGPSARGQKIALNFDAAPAAMDALQLTLLRCVDESKKIVIEVGD